MGRSIIAIFAGLTTLAACASDSATQADGLDLTDGVGPDTSNATFRVSLFDGTTSKTFEKDLPAIAARVRWIFAQNGITVDVSPTVRTRPITVAIATSGTPCTGGTSATSLPGITKGAEYFHLGGKDFREQSIVYGCTASSSAAENLRLTAHAVAHEILHALFDVAYYGHLESAAVPVPIEHGCSALQDEGHLDALPSKGCAKGYSFNLNTSGHIGRPDAMLGKAGFVTNDGSLTPFETIVKDAEVHHIDALRQLDGLLKGKTLPTKK